MQKFLIIAFLALTGCHARLQPSGDHNVIPQNNYTHDPEGLICEASNGKIKSLKFEERDVTFCQLDRALIGSESLFKFHEQGVSTEAIKTFQNHADIQNEKSKRSRKLKLISMGNPSVLYCMQQGGDAINYRFNNSNIIICRLKDGSKISAWTLFNGPSEAFKLTNALAPDETLRIGKNVE